MIRTDHSNFPVAAMTHPGMTGKNNEDRYAVSAYRLNRRSRVPVLFAVLSDGIGGHRAGEVAAEISVEAISRGVAASKGNKPVETLRQAIQQASREIFALAQNDPVRQGMGATCACAWVIDKRLYTATVGDSRAYLLRRGGIYQLSTDHTWVQEAVEQGILKPQDIQGHPNQHVIRRYIGSPTPPEVDFRLRLPEGDPTERSEQNQGLLLTDGDRVLLCSDGLTDLVEDREIAAAFQRYPLEQANRVLVNLANQRGGHDNITLVVIEIPRRSLLERVATSNRLFAGAVLAAVLLTVVLFTGLVLTIDRLNNRGNPLPTRVVLTIQATQGLPVVLASITTTPLASVTPVLSPTQVGAATLTLTTSFTPPSPTASRTLPPLPSVAAATPTPWPTNTVAAYP